MNRPTLENCQGGCVLLAAMLLVFIAGFLVGTRFGDFPITRDESAREHTVQKLLEIHDQNVKNLEKDQKSITDRLDDVSFRVYKLEHERVEKLQKSLQLPFPSEGK